MGKFKGERFNVPEKEIEDFTNPSEFIWKDETYEFIEDYPSRDCDGECHNMVMQRKSDGKYFEYSWMYSHGSGNYYYEPSWVEVKKVVKTSWERV